MAVDLVAIEKPSGASAPILGTVTYIGSTDFDTNTVVKFKIKLINYDFRSRVPMEETSGDGDEGPTFDYVPWTYVSLVIDGIYIASEPVGVDNLRAGQTLTTAISVKLGAIQTFTLPGAVIHSINISGTRRGLFNRVQMSMESTGQTSLTVFETA